MTTNPGEFGPQGPQEGYESVREQAAFLQDVAEVIHQLPTLKEPLSDSHIFDFLVLPSTDYALPSALDAVKYKVNAISVALGDARRPVSEKDQPTSAFLSVEFLIGDDTYTVSADGEQASETYTLTRLEAADYSRGESTRSFVDRLKEVGTVSKKELNAFLMSIAMPNPTHDYEAYADKNLLSADAYESLIELLARASMDRIDNYHFMLDDEETEVHFTKESGQIISFDISYYDAHKKLPVTVEYLAGTGFTLEFFTFEEARKHPFAPTGEEINRVRQIVQKQFKTIVAEPFQIENGEVVEPESVPADTEHALENEFAGQVDDLLNELGLNPPNTGA